ncbi:MAG: aspartate aminotransferase family protein [Solirubrobacterales bacterium]
MTVLEQDSLAAVEKMKARFAELHPGSQRLYGRAKNTLAGGTSHNFRTSPPFPLYVKRGEGPLLWDVDGLEYVDYSMSGASQLVGYADPRIVAAMAAYDAGRGGAVNSELEVDWGERIKELYPSVDLVRFTGSGSDSSTLAFRLVRGYTGKEKILRFTRAYHGWHDHAAIGYAPHEHVPTGIPAGEGASIVTASLDGDLDEAARLLAGGDIAGMIVEPSGAGMGLNPLPYEKILTLRSLARDAGVQFICDENVTGFRWAPGGVQELVEIDPDITLLGKIATAGFPGAICAGKAALMDQVADGVRSAVGHSGTYNGHPVVATAAIAMIDAVRDGGPQRAAQAFSDELKAALNGLLAELGIAGFAYGPSSIYWVYLHPADGARLPIEPGVYDEDIVSPEMLSSIPLELIEALYCGLCNNGVTNTIFNGGFASSVHGPNELARTVDAYRNVLTELRDLGIVATA